MAEVLKLGRYELRRVLGKGAMGVVYEGFDPSLSRRVAVKTILKSVAIDRETERDYAARFTQEAKAVARLNHPNIVQVYDFGMESEVAYLVMEFIQGRELRSAIAGGEQFGPSECVRIMGELLDALEFAHEAGVIHRDIKPANVMLDGQQRVKLADFGVARVQDSDRSAAGTMVGTPAFMSPEQISGGKIDRRTDIFSAGIVLYQLLTSEQPFKGEGAWTVAKQIMQDDPPRPSSLVASVSPLFDDIVERALAKAPADRYANAREFAAELRAALGPVPVPSPFAPKPKVRAVAKGTDAEVAFWRSIQDSSNAEEFKVYLEQYPQGTYARLARVKLEGLHAAPQRGAGKSASQDATVAIAEPRLPEAAKRSSVVPAGIALILIAAGVGAYVFLGRTPWPAPIAQAPEPPKVEAVAPPPKAEVSATDIEKIRKETEERIQRDYADKSAAEQAAAKAAAAKAAADKAAQEKQMAEKAAAEKAVAERIAGAERAAVASERAAAERLAAAERAVRAVAEKAAEEKAARATAEKAADEKAAAEKAAALAAAPRGGMRPGRYAFRIMPAASGTGSCGQINVQEDVDIRPGSAQNIVGKDFTELRFQSVSDSTVVATATDVRAGTYNVEVKLAGSATTVGYAGTYEVTLVQLGCKGQWTMVRKSIAPEGIIPGRYAFRIMPASSGSPECGRIDIQEDVEIRPGSAQSIVGRDFTELRFQSVSDSTVVATVTDVRAGTYNVVANLAGSATAVGYAGKYVTTRLVAAGCNGQWSMVRKGN